MITDNELSRLADMAQCLRPEWPARTTRAFLARTMRNRAYADLALALAAVAVDPESTSPARVEQPGRWWLASKANAGQSSVPEVGPGKGVPSCDRVSHEHEAAHACRACRAEQLAETEVSTPSARFVSAPPPVEITEVAERRRRLHLVQAGTGRNFAQTEELPGPDAAEPLRCTRCGGVYLASLGGPQAHRAVFGHEPQSEAS